MFKFLNSLPVRVATLVLLVQGGLLYSSIREEVVPVSRPLSSMPRQLGPWQFAAEGVVDAETNAILQADDTLIRSYTSNNAGVELFVASFRSQRTGKAPHSPKNCLPGSGWTPLDDREISVDIGREQPIQVNRYIIAHGDSRSLVLYWYQSRDRAVAGEFKAKFWVMADALRYNRTDTALVRVIVPIRDKDEVAADRTANEFVKSMYSTLLEYLPKAS
ncbi:MAG: exosortase C-terminal domain/associated protein EpsI [Bryobacteraceae bacterium]